MLLELLLFFVVGPLVSLWILTRVALFAGRMVKRQQQADTDPHPLWNTEFQEDPPPGEVWPPAPQIVSLTEE